MSDSVYGIALHISAPTGQEVIQTLHVRHTAAGAAASIASDFLTGPAGDYGNVYPSAYTLDSVRVREIKPHGTDQPAEAIGLIGTPGVRATSGDMLAPWLAVRATLYSTLAGKRRRGATSFAGGAEVDVNANGDLNTEEGSWYAQAFICLDALQAFYDDHTAKGQLVVFSRKAWSLGGTDSSVWTADVVSFILHSRLRSMRSRQTL